MERAAAAGSEALAPHADQPIDPEPSVPANIPRLDESGERIFIPDIGWLPAAEFWDRYDNDPGSLPGNLDFHAIHLLREASHGDSG